MAPRSAATKMDAITVALHSVNKPVSLTPPSLSAAQSVIVMPDYLCAFIRHSWRSFALRGTNCRANTDEYRTVYVGQPASDCVERESKCIKFTTVMFDSASTERESHRRFVNALEKDWEMRSFYLSFFLESNLELTRFSLYLVSRALWVRSRVYL